MKVLLKMLIQIRGKYYREGGTQCKNPQGYTIKNKYDTTTTTNDTKIFYLSVISHFLLRFKKKKLYTESS